MFLVGIAGGSGSGKTTFAHKVSKRVSSPDVLILHQDSYYLDNISNFDHPQAFDWALLRDHLDHLRGGGSVEAPVYEYGGNRRSDTTLRLGPAKVILFEGIFALWNEKIRDLLDIKVFLSIDADIRFIRRLHRDVHERSRTLDSIIRQYYDTVRPMHREFIENTRQFADMVVGEESDIAADILAARVRQILG